MEPETWRDAAADLLLGSSCAACGRPGRLLCRGCRGALPRTGVPAWPTPTPAGLAPPYATGPYEPPLRDLVLGLKERGLHRLARPLGEVLAGAVAAAVEGAGGDGAPLVLVPVPSRPASVRERGLDTTLALTRAAARSLGHGWPGGAPLVAALLRTRPGVVDQAGLGAAARQANLAGSMTCPTPGLRRLARRTPRAVVVVCDDVVTTGATAREAQRALEAVGLTVAGIAAVAATPRRVGVRSRDPAGT